MTTMVNVQIDARGIAWVTMNNPAKHNAFDDAIIAELQEAFEMVENNPDVRIMVLAAEGKSFSAGADLAWMQRMADYGYEENLRDARALAQMLHTLNNLTKPTIARVQGAAFGGAVGLVGCCDIAIASPRASFSLSEVRIGLVPATIAPYVVAAMGARAARRYFQTAERFSADTALHLGLVSQLVEEDQLDATIEQQINTLLSNSPAAMHAAKQLVFDVMDQPVTEALIEATSQLIANIRISPEGQEGLKAFLQKRTPSYLQTSEK